MRFYNISEKLGNASANKYRVHCYNPLCYRPIEKGCGFPVWIDGKGKRYVCEEHRNWSNLDCYHGNASDGYDVTLGTPKRTPLAQTTIGVEIECIGHYDNDEITTLRAKLESTFYTHGEHDATVNAEFPTSKMQGLARISKVLQSMEKRDLIKYVDNNGCGAHIHCGCNDVPYVRRYYHSLFIPLCEYLDGLGEDKRLSYFGSDFRYYASRITRNTEPLTHSNFVNTQHTHTLEFRLPRITGYLQYMACLKFWREVVFTINQFDFCKDADSATRKTKAQKCGALIVDVARKYFK